MVACTDLDVSRRWHIVGLSIAFEHIVFAACNFDPGNFWIGKLRFDEHVEEVSGIPKRMKVVAITPSGYLSETLELGKALSDIVQK